LNTTCEVSMPPVPFREMLAGVAEINWIEPTVGAVTTRFVAARYRGADWVGSGATIVPI
jgi:hypothetical protein